MIPRLAGLLGLVGTLIVIPSSSAESVVLLDVDQGKGKPKATMRVNPSLLFVPGRLVATVELTGGADDFQDFYCPKIEWEWGDETRSDSGQDCDPYEAGKSQIRRRYTEEHSYKDPAQASYDVIFRMKQGTKTVLSLRQTVRAR